MGDGRSKMATNEAVIRIIRDAYEDGKSFVTAGELKQEFLRLNIRTHRCGRDVIEKVNRFIEMESNDDDTKLKVEEAIILFELDKEPKDLAKSMFEECDLNEDGFISKEELVKYLDNKIGFDKDDYERNRMIEW